MAPRLDALVLDARLRQSLVAVRSLGRRGLAVAALDTVADLPAFQSRWCRTAFVCPAAPASAAYIAYLEQLIDRPGTRFLVSSHDGTIAALREHRARLERNVRLALASERALRIAINKERTLSLAATLGIHVPRGRPVASVRDVGEALDEIGLPAVVKPTESWLSNTRESAWVGPQLVTTREEARRAVAAVERHDGIALIQTLLSGRREAVSLFYANGQVYARFAQWAKRMNPPMGGESVLRQSIAVPSDTGHAAEQLVRAIGLDGYSEVEFRRDSAGVPYLMEINPRLSASVEIAVRAGVDFPHLLYQWACGDPIDRVGQYRVGGWMRYLQGDVTATVAALEQRGRPGIPRPLETLAGFGFSFLKPMPYDYLDWKDPLPGAAALTDLGRELARSSMRSVRRTLAGVRKTFVSDSVPQTSSKQLPVPQHYDAVVVGAGPYGLSTAAHLRGRGLSVGVFGRTLELWRDRMPKGMLLRSHWWATNLSDPNGRYSFERFLHERGLDKCYPMPRETFIDYGLWFQQHAVPDVDQTYVSLIDRRNDQFALTLQDGRTVTSDAVVLATGFMHYPNRPEAFAGLRPGLVSHSSEADDFTRFDGRDVIVIGAGQSAIEYAALLNEAGARVHVVCRRPIAWRARDRAAERSLTERILAPNASIAPGWDNWILDRAPYLFYRFPQADKDSYNSNYMSGAADWLRNRIIGKVTLHESRTVSRVQEVDGRVAATLSSGESLIVDHVMLATGYKVDITQLKMIHPSLMNQIATDNAVPILNHWFETTVPGLYVVGLSSLRAFGPLYRFVAGCGAAARRVARSVARTRPARSGAARPLHVTEALSQ